MAGECTVYGLQSVLLQAATYAVITKRPATTVLFNKPNYFHYTFSLPHRQQTVLITVAERTLSYRLEVPGVNSTTGNRVAALTHAGVITQAPFVQVRMGESITARNPLGLEKKKGSEKSSKHVQQCRKKLI